MSHDDSNFASWSEQQHQEELFSWASKEIEKGRESLRLLGSIPNGARALRWNAINRYDEMGYRSGMPDVYFLLPAAPYHGLFIELKSLKPTITVSKKQIKMLGLLEEKGYKTAVCRGFEEAIRVINNYEEQSK
jgi:hypothetical protein